jgi:hypothetical protein
MTIGDVIRRLVVALHLVLAAVLIAMSLPRMLTIKEQLDSGYVPPYTLLLVVLVVLPLLLAGLIVRGLVLWSRERRGFLVAVDTAVMLASWSVLVIFVFANDLPIAAVVLAPIVLLGAAVAPRAQAAA